MSNSSKNITVTVTIVEGVPTFSYAPDGPIIVTESTDVIFTLSNTSHPAVSFKEPLISYVPVDASRNITLSLSADEQSLTLRDTDIDKEVIGVQLVIKDAYRNTYASPDPQIINRD
ncbi:DP-EP family protein [Paraglaciecola psychrophila]|uniref:Uncharacterized protein n=1 Tax=Paraglaciecola psychrophila 170 TaxID=1129794 RepID=K6ZTX8_9ALTE|nr:DP-EP family protein [Paraglaciecola psychrophila]AGH47122.1 hypothetical protein C427_5023 [Paraglaciecola psychrophila 170]GAC39326.1 hypothetical protein GPSY_3715 [Paraglaciecola psychrophila 170]